MDVPQFYNFCSRFRIRFDQYLNGRIRKCPLAYAKSNPHCSSILAVFILFEPIYDSVLTSQVQPNSATLPELSNISEVYLFFLH